METGEVINPSAPDGEGVIRSDADRALLDFGDQDVDHPPLHEGEAVQYERRGEAGARRAINISRISGSARAKTVTGTVTAVANGFGGTIVADIDGAGEVKFAMRNVRGDDRDPTVGDVVEYRLYKDARRGVWAKTVSIKTSNA